MSTPKSRQFKYFYPYLEIYNNNKFIDGVNGEKGHRFGKNVQQQHDNHQTPYKRHVTQTSQNRLTFLFALNEGRWGPLLQYAVGNLVNLIKNPLHPELPNDILLDYIFPSGVTDSSIIEVTKYLGKNHKPNSEQQLKQLLNPKRFGRIRRQELMDHVNAAAIDLGWIDQSVTFHDICTSGDWSVSKILNFRYHLHSQSFAMGFDSDNDRCIMKTDNNFIFEFKNAYSFKYLDNEILLGFGNFWPIIKSRKGKFWVNDKFNTMDRINYDDRRVGWYFLTNLVEPVFLIHDCLDLANVRHTFPKKSGDNIDFKSMNSTKFFKHLLINMHKLRIEHYEGEHTDMQMPCGPIYKCKKHGKWRCDSCPHTEAEYDSKHWNVEWKCNVFLEKHYWIFDQKNGLDMTLMKTVKRDSEFIYE